MRRGRPTTSVGGATSTDFSFLTKFNSNILDQASILINHCCSVPVSLIPITYDGSASSCRLIKVGGCSFVANAITLMLQWTLTMEWRIKSICKNLNTGKCVFETFMEWKLIAAPCPFGQLYYHATEIWNVNFIKKMTEKFFRSPFLQDSALFHHRHTEK